MKLPKEAGTKRDSGGVYVCSFERIVTTYSVDVGSRKGRRKERKGQNDTPGIARVSLIGQ